MAAEPTGGPGLAWRAAAGVAILALLLLLLAPLAVAQLPDQGDMLRDSTLSEGRGRTRSGEIIADIWTKVVWVSAAVFLLVTVVLVYSLIRFRRRPGVKREVPQIHGNSRLEIAWTIGPALIMIWLLVISYNGLMAIDLPDEQPEVHIDVEGNRFFWSFTYPDGTESVGADALLRLEEGRWVQLNVTTTDVLHAISIPGLDVMIDAPPGRQNEVLFYTGHEPGVYLVQCRQFCGAGHGEMVAAVEIFTAGSQPLPYGAPPRELPEAPVPAPGTDNQTDPDNGTTDPAADASIDVLAFDFDFDPQPLEVETNRTFEVVFQNQGPSPHNLYIGTYDHGSGRGEPFCPDPDDEASCWRTRDNIGAGQSDRFTFSTPGEPIAFDVWCNIPGHVGEGMITFISIGGGVLQTDPPPEPRLPGPGAALLVAALGALFVVLRRVRRAQGVQQD